MKASLSLQRVETIILDGRLTFTKISDADLEKLKEDEYTLRCKVAKACGVDSFSVTGNVTINEVEPYEDGFNYVCVKFVLYVNASHIIGNKVDIKLG